MKILHIISSLETGGAQKLVGDLVSHLNKDSEFDVKLVVCRATGSKIEDMVKNNGVEIISLNSHERSPLVIPKLIPVLKWADVVHAHLFPTDYMVTCANKFVNKPIIYTEHSTHNRRRDHKFFRPFEKWLYKNFDKVVCISDATAQSLSNWIGKKIAYPRTLVIENGIDVPAYEKVEQTNSVDFFGKEGLPILMISRFTESKDHPTVLKALKLLNRKDVFVVFVGDGELREEMETMAKKIRVDKNVIFLGTRHDIPHIIKNSYLGIQASNWEGFGLTSIEMMAGGIPVIVSDVEGLSDIVGDAALKFPKGNPHALAKLIKKLIDSKESYSKYILAGKNKASEYSLERMASEYKNVYSSFKKKEE